MEWENMKTAFDLLLLSAFTVLNLIGTTGNTGMSSLVVPTWSRHRQQNRSRFHDLRCAFADLFRIRDMAPWLRRFRVANFNSAD